MLVVDLAAWADVVRQPPARWRARPGTAVLGDVLARMRALLLLAQEVALLNAETRDWKQRRRCTQLESPGLRMLRPDDGAGSLSVGVLVLRALLCDRSIELRWAIPQAPPSGAWRRRLRAAARQNKQCISGITGEPRPYL